MFPADPGGDALCGLRCHCLFKWLINEGLPGGRSGSLGGGVRLSLPQRSVSHTQSLTPDNDILTYLLINVYLLLRQRE